MTDIRIYCCRESHAAKVSEVATMRSHPNGSWGEAPEKAHAVKMASGGSRDREIPETPFQIMQDAAGNRWARWDFRCGLDARHNFQVRQDKLFPALDEIARTGESNVSLLALAAILERLARARAGA